MCESFPILAIGRRKTAVAQVQIQPGTGVFSINNKIFVSSFQETNPYFLMMQEPLITLEEHKKIDSKQFDIVIKVHGGGVVGQAQAIQLGLARACCKIDQSWRSNLKPKGFLTRDARAKERRKYGLKKARKAPQFSKR